jgi:flagellar biosynthesis protein FlhF
MNEDDTQVKRFFASSMSRALELVKEELGSEAVILSSNRVDGGVEILTSVEPDLPTRGIHERRAFGGHFDTDLDQALDSDASWETQAGIEQAAAKYVTKVERNTTNTSQVTVDGENIAAAIERAHERMLEAKRAAAAGELESARPKGSAAAKEKSAARVKQSVIEEQKLEGLRSEIADLRMLLEQQMWQRSTSVVDTPSPELPASALEQTALAEHLARLGLSKDLVAQLCGRAQSNNERLSQAWKMSLARLSQNIQIAKHLDIESGGTYAFVGPTGVGKTTTLAKLAAQFSLKHGPGKVALISMDTHRVGAVEQLRAMSRILEVPLRIVDAQNSLMTTLASLRNFPLVLIDTAGFRQGDPQLHDQLLQLDQNPSVQRLLVLSAFSQAQTLKASIHAYRPRLDRDACVISKIDEACSLGEILSVAVDRQLPLAYVTDGQKIPEDIRRANGHNLVANAVNIAKQNGLTNQKSI